MLYIIVAMALLMVSLIPRSIKPVWSTKFLPGSGVQNMQRGPFKLQAYPPDKLLDIGLLEAPAIIEYSGKTIWSAANEITRGNCLHAVIGKDGSIYIGTSKNEVYAFDAQQQLRWVFPARGTKVWSCFPAIAPDGTVYATASDGFIYAIDPDGVEIWSREIENLSGRRPPAVGPDGTVYAATSNLELLALSPVGEVRWNSGARTIGSEEPLFATGLVVCIRSHDGMIRAFNPDGTLAWDYSMSSRLDADSASVGPDGTIYLFCDEGSIGTAAPQGTGRKLIALYRTGQLKWEAAGFDQMFGGYAVLPDSRVCLIKPQMPASAVTNITMNLQLMLLRHGTSHMDIVDSSGSISHKGRVPSCFPLAPPIVLLDGSLLLLSESGR